MKRAIEIAGLVAAWLFLAAALATLVLWFAGRQLIPWGHETCMPLRPPRRRPSALPARDQLRAVCLPAVAPGVVAAGPMSGGPVSFPPPPPGTGRAVFHLRGDSREPVVVGTDRAGRLVRGERCRWPADRPLDERSETRRPRTGDEQEWGAWDL
jgi:hypothetical protein